jgi:hypothetical protein
MYLVLNILAPKFKYKNFNNKVLDLVEYYNFSLSYFSIHDHLKKIKIKN